MGNTIDRLQQVQGLDAVYGPYSTATRAGRTIYVSGRIASAALWESSLDAQTRAVMRDIQTVLQGFDPAIGIEHVTKTEVFLPHGADFREFNAAYMDSFEEGQYPARTCVRAEAPIDGPAVEISAIAVMSLGTWARVALRNRGLLPAVKAAK